MADWLISKNGYLWPILPTKPFSTTLPNLQIVARTNQCDQAKWWRVMLSEQTATVLKTFQTVGKIWWTAKNKIYLLLFRLLFVKIINYWQNKGPIQIKSENRSWNVTCSSYLRVWEPIHHAVTPHSSHKSVWLIHAHLNFLYNNQSDPRRHSCFHLYTPF